MAKKKKGLADKVRQAKHNKKSMSGIEKVRNNPFEIKINKQKHAILGRKTKHDRGLPGVSRSKSFNKRKDTLLKEYKQRNKASIIKDERFGVDNSQISLEEKMLQRFSLERKKRHEKMSQFNLNDDEELTHMGQSLSAINKFDDYNESDEEESGVMSGDYVSHAHFGGGIFSKKENPEHELQQDDGPKSKKDIIEEIIAKSKQAKFEKQAKKEKSEELCDKLDDAWKDFERLIKSSIRTDRDKESARNSSRPDDYDVVVKQMLFEKKAAPSEKSKTEEELRAEREAEMKRQEEERIKRMHGDVTNEKKSRCTHQSADALEEDYFVTEPEEEAKLLSFDADEEEEEEEDNENDENSDDDVSPVDDDAALPAEEESELGDLGIVDDQEAEEQEDPSEESDDFSDIDSGNEDDEDIVSLEEEEERSAPKDQVKKTIDDRKVEANKFPTSYAEFASHVLASPSPPDVAALKVTAGLRKRFAPELKQGNKARMVDLFAYVWEHCCMMASATPPRLDVISKLSKQIHELCALNVDVCSECIRERLKRSYQSCFLSSQAKANKVSWPALNVLIQFKMIKNLFSTSDFRHPVVTPSFYFICNLLTRCRLLSVSDVTRGLFACTLLYEYVCFSKRFVPECINFLTAILCMSLPRQAHGKAGPPATASMHLNKRNIELLLCHEDFDDESQPNFLSLISCEDDDDESAKHYLLATALKLSHKFVQLYTDLTAFDQVFLPMKRVCQLLLDNFSQSHSRVCDHVQDVLRSIASNCGKPRKPLTFGKSKPKPLRMIDPKVEETGEPFQKRSRKANPSKRERERLLHKRRRELKGAVREIRKDNRFIGRHQQKEQEEMDAEREAKVKRLYGLLSNQEGDVRKIERKKYKLEI